MRVQGCDRKCESCPLLEICGGIEQYGIHGYRCPYAGCALKVPAIKRMQECNVCRIDKKTWEMTEEEVEKLVSEVESLSKVKSHSIELPSVVLMVSLKDPASYHFDTIDVGAIVVMFEDLFDRGLKTYYRTIKRGSGYLYLKNLRHF